MADEAPRPPHPSQAREGTRDPVAAPTGGAATAPRLAPWLALYTLGRLLVAAALVAVLWLVGLGSFPGLLFGLLLSMPASYVLLRPVRDRLTEALAARRARRAEFRARLAGSGDDAA